MPDEDRPCRDSCAVVRRKALDFLLQGRYGFIRLTFFTAPLDPVALPPVVPLAPASAAVRLQYRLRT